MGISGGKSREHTVTAFLRPDPDVEECRFISERFYTAMKGFGTDEKAMFDA
eukprot:gene14033-9936_t